jgi:hypothetical protein
MFKETREDSGIPQAVLFVETSASQGQEARKNSGCAVPPVLSCAPEHYRYQYSLTPTDGGEMAFKEPSRGDLGWVIKAGACIEASFKRGKGEVGMDEYQVRTWQGWHHHMALSLMAVWFLVGETHRGQ